MAKALALLRSAFETVRTKLGAMSKPARVMLFSTAVAAVLITSYVGYRSSETTWATLFSNLDREDGAAVVAKLKEMKVPYRVEGDGTSIEVPQANVRELRLELAGAGLPRGGGVGFESFDKLRLGATEFEQRVLYRRSLEGELSRTIDTIAAVQSSRVHLVLPERSVFVGRAEPASASIVLKLRPGRSLGASEVTGVVHLVSSSVAQLTPDHVAVVTTEGTVLHKPRRSGEGEGASDADVATSSARSLEATLEERARSMLEKVVGPGHVDVRVSAELDRSRVERVEDRYDPKQAVLRSEQSSVERTQTDTGATGVPGAESNLPSGSARPAAADGGVATRESYTRNFEVDHVTEKRVVVGGTLRRLTVAVVVDGRGKDGQRSKEDVDRLTALVRSAVGADDKRGDMVTVESVPFLEADVVAPAPPRSLVPGIPEAYRRYVPFAAVGAGALVLVGFAAAVALLARSRRRARAARQLAISVAAVATAKDTAAQAVIVEKLDPEELRARAHDCAATDPATAALVLRFWLGEGADRSDNARSLGEGIRIA
jgi:flagellar M-ring protein FliF